MEEEGIDELKLGKFKAQNLKKMFDEASSVASSVLMFTLKWRDLEQHYDNLQKDFEEKAQELVLLQKGAETTNEVLQEIGLKQRELVSLQTLIEECSGQLEAKKKELALVEGFVGDCSMQFNSRQKELISVKKSVQDCSAELELKKEELISVKKSVQECHEERQGKEEELTSVREELGSCSEEINLKKEELNSVRKLIESHREEFGSKERRLQVVQKMLDRFSIDACEKKKEIDDLQSSLKQVSKEFELRQGDLDSRTSTLKALDDELELKKNKLELLQDLTTEIQEKEQHVSSLRSLIEEYSEELVNKEKEYDSINKSVANCCAELKSRRKELERINNSVTDQTEELDLRKVELHEVRCDIREAEKRLMTCNAALELKMREFDGLQKCIKDTDEQLQINRASVEKCKKELAVKEERLARILESTQACSEDVQSKEQQLVTVEELNAHLESKNKEIALIENAQHECLKELKLKEKQDDSLKESVNELSKELQMKERELQDSVNNLVSKEKQINCVQQAIDEEKVELELKEKHNGSQRKLLDERFQELDIKEGQIQAHTEVLELNQKGIDAVLQAVEEQRKKLELKKEVNDSQKKLLNEGFQELHIKEGQLQARIEELESKEKQVDAVRQESEEQRKELDLKKKNYESEKILLDEGFQELHIKEGQLQACTKDLESKEKQMDALRRAVEEQRKELDEREKLIDLQRKSLEESMREVVMKEGQLKDHFKELELKEKQLAAFQQAMEEERKELELKQRQLTETVHSEKEIVKLDVRSLQALLIELLNKHNLVHKQITSFIKTSSDPAALILDVMQGFYPPHLKEDGEESDIDIVRKSCILLLDQLIANPLHIGPQAQEGALKLAHLWKTKMSVTSENQLEVLGFLHLLAAFRLTSAFNVDEVQALLDLVMDDKKALKLRQVLEIPKSASVSRILNHVRSEQLDRLVISNVSNAFSSDQVGAGSLCLYEPTLTEGDILSALQTSPDPAKFVLDVIQDRHFKYMKDQIHEAGLHDDCLKLCVFMLEHLMQISPPVQADVKMIAAKLGAEWKEKLKPDAANSLEVLVFLQFVAAYGLMSNIFLHKREGFQLLQVIASQKQAPAICRALNFVDMLSDSIHDLVAKRKYIEAVRIVCAFELKDKFTPAQLLEKYNEEIKQLAVDVCNKGENSLEAQHLVIDRMISSLREIMQCIRDFNLESDISSQVLETCIGELEKEKVMLRSSAVAPTCTKRSSEASMSPIQPQVELRSPNPANASTSRIEELICGNKRLRTGEPVVAPLDLNSSTPQQGVEVAPPRRIPARFGLTPEQVSQASDANSSTLNNLGNQQLLHLL